MTSKYIKRLVNKHLHIRIGTKTRERRFTYARRLYYALCHELCKETDKEIAAVLGQSKQTAEYNIWQFKQDIDQPYFRKYRYAYYAIKNKSMMKLKKFLGTQGEWVKSKETPYRIEIKDGLIDVWGFDVTDREIKANVDLVVTAPELLEKHMNDLKHLKTWREKLVDYGLYEDVLFSEYEDMIDSKQKIINKALGNENK